MSGYVTVDELRAYTKDVGNLDESLYSDAIEAASREIDGMCGRYFSQDAAVSAQYFWPTSYTCVPVDDISTTTGLLVDVDINGNGSYSQSWTLNTDFYLEPVNQNQGGIVGWPYTELRSTLQSKFFPTAQQYLYVRPTVRVTARWGWAAVPAAVKQATKVAATKLYKLSDAPFGVAGFDAFGAVRVRDIPEIVNLLGPFMQDRYAVA
jgi:hypothetical protein